MPPRSQLAVKMAKGGGLHSPSAFLDTFIFFVVGRQLRQILVFTLMSGLLASPGIGPSDGHINETSC